jgi:hypothetical protein
MREVLPKEFCLGLSAVNLKEDAPLSCQDIVSNNLVDIPENFQFATFGLDDVMAISRMPERADYVYKKYVIENFIKGDLCLGIKCQGEIVAFTWVNLKKCHSKFYPAEMGSNEAYLYDMYVLKKFRCKNLATALRFKNYEVLRGMGRNIFYSITERSNAASFRFKQKLGAEVVFLGLYVEILGKFRKRWVLRRY